MTKMGGRFRSMFVAALGLGATALGVAMVPGAALGASPADAALDRLYEAAKSEGKVSVVCAPSAPLRKELTEAFTKRFPGVEFEIQGMTGNALYAKLRAEERAGIYPLDIILSGTTTGTTFLKPNKMIRPLDPLIVSAEARDPSKWAAGGFDWADAEKTVMAMMLIVLPSTVYNTDLVKSGELTSDKDLLDPKWKGKIAINNPALPGAAGIMFRQFYDLHGPDFIRAFFTQQNPTVTKDLRQLIDWVAKGQYAIGVGYSSAASTVFIEQGVKTLGFDTHSGWKDQLILSPGFGAIMVPTNVPHKAASQLFLNWVLTREGQTAMVNGLQYPSRRLDVSQDPVPKHLRPIPGRNYTAAYTEAWLTHPNEDKLKELYKELNIGAR